MGKRLLFVAALVASSLAPASAAEAHNRVTASQFPYCTDGAAHPCWADNATHVYLNESLGNMTTYGLERAMWGSYDTTDLTIRVEANGHNDKTDAVYMRSSTLADGTYARVVCVYGMSYLDVPRACDHWHVQYNIDWMVELGWHVDTPANREKVRYVACHETGHSVGLTHGEDGDPAMSNSDDVIRCMQTPPEWNDYGLGTHNVAHINGHYP